MCGSGGGCGSGRGSGRAVGVAAAKVNQLPLPNLIGLLPGGAFKCILLDTFARDFRT